MTWHTWLPVIEVAIIEVLALAAHAVVFRAMGRSAARHKNDLHMAMVRTLLKPTRAVLFIIVLLISLVAVSIPAAPRQVVQQILALALIVVVAWVLIALTQVMEEIVAARWDISVKDNLEARKMRTRVAVMRRVMTALILVVTAAALLMTFPEVRTLGASLLASAGLVGLVAGLAAQPVLTNLIAGLQIALTQPIRIDDVVIVDNQWGWIEEIDTTYVVVRIWDLRRLIVPLNYFLQQPFQNWTYRSADLLGYVHIYADYSVSVGALREELQRILKASSLWDGQVWNLQVTGSDGHTLQMRALFSATDSGNRWNLMVEVREQMIAFLQARYPEHLPRTRVEYAPGPRAAAFGDPAKGQA